MRKRIFGRRFKRDVNERKALFRNLMHELVLHGKIKTTEAKAKAIKAEVEKMVTKAKVKGDGAAVHLQKTFTADVVEKLINDISPLFKDRQGGYTRIIRMGNRVKDSAPMVLMEWVEEVKDTTIVENKKRVKKVGTKKAEQKKEDKAPKKESSKASK